MRKTSQSVLLLLATALLFLPARSHAASPTSTAYDELRSRGFPRGLLRANVTLEAGSGDFAVDLVSGSRIVLPAHFCLTRKSVAVGFDRSLHHDELMASLLHALSGHVEELLRVVVYPAAKSLHHYEFMASLLHALSGHVEELLGRVVVDPAATCLVADTCLVWPVKLARKLGIAYVTEPVLIFNLYYVHLLTKNGHIGINEYAEHQRASEKTDIYSFGVVLLELATGLTAMGAPEGSLVEWAWRLLEEHPVTNDEIKDKIKKQIDKSIRDSGYLEDIIKVLELGVSCTSNQAHLRPPMMLVLTELMHLDRRPMLGRSRFERGTSSSQYGSLLQPTPAVNLEPHEKGKEVVSIE